MPFNRDAIVQKLKGAWQRIVDIWKKYEKRQKILILSITVAIIVAIIVMVAFLTKTTYVELITCESSTAAADIDDLLTEEAITYKISSDGLTFYVPEEQLNTATYVIAQSGYTASGYTYTSITDALGGGFSTTSDDKEKLYQKYLEDKMKSVLEDLEFVNEAKVTFSIPDSTLSVLDSDEETSVAITLKLSSEVPTGAGTSMANYVATAVGNSTTNNIIIIDSNGNTIFQGDSESSIVDLSVSDREAILELFTNSIKEGVSSLVGRLPNFSAVAVSPALEIIWSTTDTENVYNYNDDNVIANEYIYKMSGGSYTGGIPGTDSNDDDTTYTISTDGDSTTEVSIKKTEYAYSTLITKTTGESGTLDTDNSSVGIVLTQYVVYNEDDMTEEQLGDLTWDEFKVANAATTKIEDLDEDITNLFIAATGISDIVVVAYQVPMFNDSEETGSVIVTYLPIILAAVIILLLAFVLWRSLRPVEVTENDAELNVDTLLTATAEAEKVSEIDIDGKSEVFKAIEKFITENPESAASLLRNWLNDDWD